jgi:hypothetical protein
LEEGEVYMPKAPLDPLDRWERKFRAAAKADHYSILRRHLSRLGVRCKPTLILDATVVMVRALAPEDEDSDFLKLQTYNPIAAKKARHVLTFHLVGNGQGAGGYGRVAVEGGLQIIDLADMNDGFNVYDSSMRHHGVVGFDQFWISRPDWSDLTDGEREQFRNEVEEDLYHDYGEGGIQIDFCDEDPEYLQVSLQELR